MLWILNGKGQAGQGSVTKSFASTPSTDILLNFQSCTCKTKSQVISQIFRFSFCMSTYVETCWHHHHHILRIKLIHIYSQYRQLNLWTLAVEHYLLPCQQHNCPFREKARWQGSESADVCSCQAWNQPSCHSDKVTRNSTMLQPTSRIFIYCVTQPESYPTSIFKQIISLVTSWSQCSHWK